MTQWWWNDNAEMARLCRSFPGYSEEIRDRADRVMKNTFWFTEKWEMERTEEPVHFPGRVEWETPPSGDPEWVFALNRHTCFLNLGQAYLLDGDERRCEKFVELLLDWTDRVTLTEERTKTSWRTIEAGLRCENWLKAWLCFRDCRAYTGQADKALRASLREHAEYMISMDDDFRALSNWGVLQNHGLFLLGVFFEDSRYLQIALERMNREMKLQIFPDGAQWEQSPMYHCEVLHCLIDTVTIARRNNVALPRGFEETVHRMVKALAGWCKPNGCLPCQSDSDEIDARDILVQGAVLYGDAELKCWGGPRFFQENLWNLGEVVNNYSGMPSQSPAQTSCALHESGNYMLRSGAGPEAEYLRFHCGCMGSGHGHADLLHIDLYSHGEDILIDPGRYTYVNNAVRRQLKRPAAHNTVVVDGRDFSEVKNSWDYTRMAMPVKGEYRFGKTAEFVSGAHLGYMDLPGGVFVSRKVVWVKPNVVVLCDEFYTAGRHRYEQYFHFAGSGKTELCPGGAKYFGNRARARFFFLHPGVHTQLQEAPFSRRYNELEQGDCLCSSVEAEGFVSLITVICTSGPDAFGCEAELLPVSLTRDGSTLPAEKAQAVRVRTRSPGGEKEAVVLLCHREVIAEVGLIEAGGYKGYGKVVVFTPENPNGECLQW